MDAEPQVPSAFDPMFVWELPVPFQVYRAVVLAGTSGLDVSSTAKHLSHMVAPVCVAGVWVGWGGGLA